MKRKDRNYHKVKKKLEISYHKTSSISNYLACICIKFPIKIYAVSEWKNIIYVAYNLYLH